MFVFILNIIIAIFLAFFTLSVYPKLPDSGFIALAVFFGWYLVLWMFSYFYHHAHFVKVPQVIRLVLFYFKELFVASVKVTFEIVTPKDQMSPAIIALPLDASTDIEITLLANFITLTPGTLSIDISEDRKTLFIHEAYVEENELDEHKKKLKEGFEKRILKITR